MGGLYLRSNSCNTAPDYSALAVAAKEGKGCSIRHLQRWKLGIAYPAICEETVALLKRAPLLSSPLIVNATGVGRPVIDLLKIIIPASRLHALTIMGGTVENKDAREAVTYWTMPKRALVSTVQILLQDSRLKIALELPEARTLECELLSFQVKITDAGNDTYGAWREGSHDDSVLAVALACWAARHKDFIRLCVFFQHRVKAKMREPALSNVGRNRRVIVSNRH